MHTPLSLASAAMLLMLSLPGQAQPQTEDEIQPSNQPTEHHHPDHQSASNDANEDTTPGQRLRKVTHPKTGHVVHRYVGE